MRNSFKGVRGPLVASLLFGVSVALPVCAGNLQDMVQVKQKVSDKHWSDFPARTIETLGHLSAEPSLDIYGGRLDKSRKKTGFFHAEKSNGRWWLVDPDGHLFLNTAVVSVSPQAGAKPDWPQQTTQFLRANYFNGFGAWSDAIALRTTPKPLVYTVIGQLGAPGGVHSGFMTSFGDSIGVTRSGIGHTHFTQDCLPVFHPGFAAFCDKFAKPLAVLKNDPYLLGYFSDNELPLPNLDTYLALDPKDKAMASSRIAAQNWLNARKGREAKDADVTEADRSAWIEYVFDRYLSVTTEAIHRYDPNHMCLGPRFYGRENRMAPVFRAAGKYLDVIGINDYGVWDSAGYKTQRWTDWSGKPVIVTEFYAKSMDSGLSNEGGAGWIVETQKARGLFYQTFTLGLLESKNCVGWQWFKYTDDNGNKTAVSATKSGSNKGIITIEGTPYTQLLDQMRAINENIYAIADHFDAAS